MYAGRHARTPPRFEQPVALAKRHVEGLGQHQQRLAAGLSSAGFDKAHVPARKARPLITRGTLHSLFGPETPLLLDVLAVEVFATLQYRAAGATGTRALEMA